jgi:uncharacterized protein YeaO (DUF488 family)
VVVRVRRAYDAPDPADGRRVLVDRLWPRGLRKEAAAVDEWLRDIAPSTDLRRWYGHTPARFAEFADRYRAELAAGRHADAVDRLRILAETGPLTILTATRDLQHAHTAVLADLLTNDADRARAPAPPQPGKETADQRPAPTSTRN